MTTESEMMLPSWLQAKQTTVGLLARYLPLAFTLVAATVGAAELMPLRVNVFPGAQNLPIYVGLARGIFEQRGIKLELQFTPNSDQQRAGLAAGKFEVAHAAVDNAVAMVEMGKQDVIIVMGGDSSMNEFIVQPTIASFGDLRGKVLVVDAPNTAYALLAKKILLDHGLQAGDYRVDPVGGTAIRLKAMLDSPGNAAGILNIPFSIVARQKGLKSMGRTVDLLGPYQATGAWVMRPWANANAMLLERYLSAYMESLRVALDPANRAECVALLVKWLKVSPEVAGETYDLLSEPKFGLTPDAKFNIDGFRNLLALRAEIEGAWGGKPPAPERYYDLSYYERALKQMKH
jgi:ABC-type nitrate/sulfonate/bicarbonate transport system substrate-binding protein